MTRRYPEVEDEWSRAISLATRSGRPFLAWWDDARDVRFVATEHGPGGQIDVVAREFDLRRSTHDPRWSQWTSGFKGRSFFAELMGSRKSEHTPLRPASWSAVERREGWAERVDAARARCARGSGTRKIVLARAARSLAPEGARFDPVTSARALRADALGSVVFVAGPGDGRVLVGATPELLASVRDGRLTTHALAGTRVRTPGSSGAALLESAKDRLEHALVVDGLRADLAPLCDAIRIAPEPRLRAVPRLHHLETPVTARLAAGVGLLDVVDALHPTPALAGAPREAALDWLRRHEPLDRGAFGAPLGYVTPDGGGDVVVAIRCALLHGAHATAFAGAGIVADSDPDAEWAETEAKLGCVTRCLHVTSAHAEGVAHAV